MPSASNSSVTSSTRHSASSRQGQAQQGGESYRKAVILFESTNSCPSESQTPCAHASGHTNTRVQYHVCIKECTSRITLGVTGPSSSSSLSVAASNLGFSRDTIGPHSLHAKVTMRSSEINIPAQAQRQLCASDVIPKSLRNVYAPELSRKV